jgi:hypothetical protein
MMIMKKTLILILALGFAFNSFSQDQPPVASEKNVMKVNTLALIIRTGAVFYEREISDLTSVQLGIAYMNYKIDNTHLDGIGITPELRFYISRNALDGFYMGPYLRYNNFGFDDNNSTGRYKAFGGGVSFGRQWIFKKGFLIDLFFGGHYTNSNITLTSGTETPDFTKIEGFSIRTGFALGFAF